MPTFNELYDLVLEYRHDYGDGTPSQSIKPNNGKDPNIVSPDKKNLHNIGPYKNTNNKININGSLLSGKELEDLGITFEDGKTIPNWKNSGSNIQMFLMNGIPVGKVIKSQLK